MLLTAFLLLCFFIESPAQVHLLPATSADGRGRHDVAAPGEYLLGAGKADITGYERDRDGLCKVLTPLAPLSRST